jgi:DNA polymerase III gamma/tau subunit
VPTEAIELLIHEVKITEKMNVPEEVLRGVAREAAGSPRRALVGLAACAGAKTRKEAAERLATVQDEGDIRDLCQALLKGAKWAKTVACLKSLESVPPETIRILVVNYMAVVAKNSKKPERALLIIEEFSDPYNESDKLAPLLLSIGNVVYD